MFAVKFNHDGSVTRLKARLVAKGYARSYGVDYFDTISPIAKLTSVRLFISHATSYAWDLHQLDIKNCLSTWRSSRRGLHRATSGVCCLGGDKEGVSASKISVWFETESPSLVWQIQSGS